MLFQGLCDTIKILVRLGQRAAFRSNVAIMESIERSLKLGKNFKRDFYATQRIVNAVAAIIPRPDCRAWTKGIATSSPHRVPIDHAEPQVILHRLAFDNLIRIVPAKG